MTWDRGYTSGSGWHAWVRPRHKDASTTLAEWRWEAVCLGTSTCWEQAPTEDAAKAAALAWVRERAEEVASRAATVLAEVGE